MKIGKIKAIVFDLDGTLYEDTHHFRYYAERIKDRLSQEVQEPFMEEYEKAAAGGHTLSIGRIYDAVKDIVLVQKDGKASQAYTWEGNPLETSVIEQLYPSIIEIDMQRFLSVGDLWWIPGSLGIHYGLDRSVTYDCFLETRQYMMSPDFNMSPVNGFKETLMKLHSQLKLILLTNSPKPDSEAILKKLGLDEVFHKKIFQAQKPTMTAVRFEEISEEFNLPFESILSVGDNFINEILPAKKLGCRTIYINAHNVGNKEGADVVVESISEMLQVLNM
jgi:FMN phosphatase YigB (HAD superfamily)